MVSWWWLPRAAGPVTISLLGSVLARFPPAGNQQARGPGHGEVKCQAQNANSCWQAVQKTCSLRLGEPWYFTKSNEHVSQHCRATIGLFKEEVQKQAAVTSQQRELFTCGSADEAVLCCGLLSSLSSHPLSARHRGPSQRGTMRVGWWTALTLVHISSVITSSGRSNVQHVVNLQRWAPRNTAWLTARASISSRTLSRHEKQIQTQTLLIQAAAVEFCWYGCQECEQAHKVQRGSLCWTFSKLFLLQQWLKYYKTGACVSRSSTAGGKSGATLRHWNIVHLVSHVVFCPKRSPEQNQRKFLLVVLGVKSNFLAINVC